MSTKNIVMDTANGFFSLISTGYPRFDKFLRRLVELSLLVLVIGWAATNYKSVGDKVVGFLSSSATVVVEQAAPYVTNGMELIGLSEVAEDAPAPTIVHPILKDGAVVEYEPDAPAPLVVVPGADSDVPAVQIE